MDCTKPRVVEQCEPQILVKETASSKCDPWSLCLPFGASLEMVDGCVRYTPPSSYPPDGTYGKVIIQDGCIVGLAPEDLPVYTDSPCAPVPTPCDCEGGSGSMPDPSVTSGNLFTYDAAGRPLAKLYTQAGSNISLSGAGTETSPLVIGTTGGAAVTVVSGTPNVITVTNNNSQYIVSHKTTGLGGRVIQGMEFNDTGHLVAYNAPADAGYLTAAQILGGTAVQSTLDQTSGMVTIDLRDQAAVDADTYLLGGINVEVSKKGQILRLTKHLDPTAGTYALGDYNVAVNSLGSIEDITPRASDGSVAHSVSKRFAAGANPVLTFQIAAASSFRISVKSASMPSGTTVQVDGNSYAGDVMGNTYEVVTNATFAPGVHNVQALASFTGPVIIDVQLSTVV